MALIIIFLVMKEWVMNDPFGNCGIYTNCLNQLSESITKDDVKENSGINSYLQEIDDLHRFLIPASI